MSACSPCAAGLVLAAFLAAPAAAKTVHAGPGAGAAPQAMYQQAIMRCRAQYAGHRSPAVDAMRPMLIETCFKQTTGKFP